MDRQKILVADDDPEIREVLRLLLTGEGYEVAEATSGEQALELLDDAIDLVILDVMMPGMGAAPPVGRYGNGRRFRYCSSPPKARTQTRHWAFLWAGTTIW